MVLMGSWEIRFVCTDILQQLKLAAAGHLAAPRGVPAFSLVVFNG